jgi:glycosyltransferase involved in cell wall biosynthesis
MKYFLGAFFQSIYVLFLSIKLKPDLIVIRLHVFPLFLAIILPMIRVDYVLKTQGPLIGSLALTRPGIKGFFAKCFWPLHVFLLKKILLNARFVDSCTYEIVDQLRDALPDRSKSKIHLIENAVDSTIEFPNYDYFFRSKLGFTSNDFVLGYFGGSPLDRGAKQMLKFLITNQSYSNANKIIFKLLIIGFSERDYLVFKNLVDSNGLNDRVVFMKRIEFCKLIPFFSAIDLGVSFDLPNRTKSVGNSGQKVKQYISAGIPVMTCAGQKLFDSFSNYGIMVDCLQDKMISLGVHSAVNNYGIGFRFSSSERDNIMQSYSIESINNKRLSLWFNQ